MVDALIVGAGPAGSVAALVLARAGARVLLIERGSGPRTRACADLLHPAAQASLAGLGLSSIGALGRQLEGLLLMGPAGTRVSVPYAKSGAARALDRRRLDAALIEAARAAGARVYDGIEAVEPLFFDRGSRRLVRGAVLRLGSGRHVRMPAGVTILADGAHSRVARFLGLSRPSGIPGRWAVAGWIDGVEGLEPRAEVHVRQDGSLSVTPLGDHLARVCLVLPTPVRLAPLPSAFVDVLRRESWLGERAARAVVVDELCEIELASFETRAAGTGGLLLAGDAAAPAAPLMCDGIHAAIRGGALAAEEALRELERPTGMAHVRLQARRARELPESWSIARARQAFISHPAAVWAAAMGMRVAPTLTYRLVRRVTSPTHARERPSSLA